MRRFFPIAALFLAATPARADPFGLPAPFLSPVKSVVRAPTGTNCGASGPWTCNAKTQLNPGGANGGTTGAIDCSASNLAILFVEYYGLGSFTGVSDSSSNSWGSPIITGGGGGGVASSLAVYAKANPAVSAFQTFTVAGTGIFATMSVLCWNSSSGTPVVDTGGVNNGTASASTTIPAGSSAYLPTVPDALVLTGVTSNSAGSPYSIDGGFTISDQIAANSGVAIGGAAAWKILPVATSLNPNWTFPLTDSLGVTTVLFGVKP